MKNTIFTDLRKGNLACVSLPHHLGTKLGRQIRNGQKLAATHLTDTVDHIAEEKTSSANEKLKPLRFGGHIDAQ